MLLINLFKNIKYLDIKGQLDVDVKFLCQNFNKVKSGCLFFCYKGKSFDGHDLASSAIEKGAVALVVERFLDVDVPQILVKNTRKVMPKVCNNFFNKVLKRVKLIGVTGTNGKTTTSHMIYNLLNLNGIKSGLIGTNGAYYLNKIVDTGLTTPDTVDLFYILNDMSKNNIKYVVMEVSAHSLFFSKLYGIKFEVGIFTNLSQDHLDFFGSMHKYALCKLKFVKKFYCKKCLINIDDKYGSLFYKLSNSKVYSYSLENPADFFAQDIQLNINSSMFTANILDEVINIQSNYPCKFNIYNLLSALGCCKLLDIDLNLISSTVKSLDVVNGRMNFYLLKNGAFAVIDFAHTPDGLEKVLLNLRQLKVNSKIITVFGCGGNRDKTKRCKMGEIATMLSDKVIVTSDNPRNEDALSIINNIISTVTKNNYEIEEDRQKAILKAINISSQGDIILIAGKGAENYQEIKGKKIPFNDKNIIANFVEK